METALLYLGSTEDSRAICDFWLRHDDDWYLGIIFKGVDGQEASEIDLYRVFTIGLFHQQPLVRMKHSWSCVK